MKFRIATQALKKGVDIVSHATALGNMTPILENILFQAQFQRLVLTANNLEMAIVATLEGSDAENELDIRGEGSYTVSSKFLTSFLPLVQETHIEVELLSNGSIEFKTTTSETKIKGIEATKFPVIPPSKNEVSQKIPALELKKAIDKTLFSTAEGNIRPTLAGINIIMDADTITCASTDSYRLSEYIFSVPGITPQQSIIFPAKAALELSRILPESGDVIFSMSDNQVRVSCQNIQLSSRLLNGFFPNYKNLFPATYGTKAIVLRNDLIVALKRNNIIAREDNFTTRIQFSGTGSLEITTGAEIGAGSIRLPASVEGQDMTIGLKSTYLLDALAVIREDYISLDFERSISPIVVRGIPESNQQKQFFKHMIMPLKI